MDYSWRLINFDSMPFCNTYSLHVLPTEKELHLIVVNINGVVHWLNKSVALHLREYLTDEKSTTIDDDFSLELVVSDTSIIGGDPSSLAYLATCWVVYDRLFAPERYFAAFFRFSHSFEVSLWKKFDIATAPTFTRLTTTSPLVTDNLYWLIFTYSKEVSVFRINHKDCAVEPVDSVGEIFPVLEIGQLPGSAIRSHCWVIGDYRFSVVGYDTGCVIASCCTMHSGTIIDRKTVKFSAPISVLRLLNPDEKAVSTSVLLSSTIGPAAIWTLHLVDGEVLVWKIATILLNSEIYDAIITGTISRDYIFIGTYGEQLLVYSTDDIYSADGEQLPLLSLNIASPIISIAFLEAERVLIVLSYKGVHIFCVSPPATNDPSSGVFSTVEFDGSAGSRWLPHNRIPISRSLSLSNADVFGATAAAMSRMGIHHDGTCVNIGEDNPSMSTFFRQQSASLSAVEERCGGGVARYASYDEMPTSADRRLRNDRTTGCCLAFSRKSSDAKSGGGVAVCSNCASDENSLDDDEEGAEADEEHFDEERSLKRCSSSSLTS